VISWAAAVRSGAFVFALAVLVASCAHAPREVLPAPAPRVVSSAPPSVDSSADGLVLGQPRVILRWQTETESNTFGYYVYRASSPDSEMACINSESPVHAVGTSNVPLKYAYFDLAVEIGKTYYYKLQSRDLDGTTEWIVGAITPQMGTAKPLTEAELSEIRTKGQAYREEAR
jgi:hypothetical protein